MAKSMNIKDVKGDVDKMFEKLSPSAAKKIDNGGTRPKKASAKKSSAKKK